MFFTLLIFINIFQRSFLDVLLPYDFNIEQEKDIFVQLNFVLIKTTENIFT